MANCILKILDQGGCISPIQSGKGKGGTLCVALYRPGGCEGGLQKLGVCGCPPFMEATYSCVEGGPCGEGVLVVGSGVLCAVAAAFLYTSMITDLGMQEFIRMVTLREAWASATIMVWVMRCKVSCLLVSVLDTQHGPCRRGASGALSPFTFTLENLYEELAVIATIRALSVTF